jgi:hypothetical protein
MYFLVSPSLPKAWGCVGIFVRALALTIVHCDAFIWLKKTPAAGLTSPAFWCLPLLPLLLAAAAAAATTAYYFHHLPGTGGARERGGRSAA